MVTTLNKFPKNNPSVIKEITDIFVSEQLASFGFHVGTELSILSKLPFDGPIMCEGNNSRIAIRAEDAATIVVTG